MPVNNVSLNRSIMVLGEVDINGQQRVVVLYNPKVMHASAFQSRAIYQGLFQKVVQGYSEEGLVKVNGAGFEHPEKGVQTHEDLKTTEAWNIFLGALEHPNLAESILDGQYTEADYAKIDPQAIYDLYAPCLDDPTIPINLDEEQKRLCKYWGCPNLANNTFNIREYLRFGERMRRPKNVDIDIL